MGDIRAPLIAGAVAVLFMFLGGSAVESATGGMVAAILWLTFSDRQKK